MHVWGCPIFVLDAKLQQGQKLPRWQQRSRRGVFLGLSSSHASDVPLILNLQTGSISSQYHVVFDDSFSTILSMEDDPPEFWGELCLERTHHIPLEKDATVHLPDDWLTPLELESKQRDINRQEPVRKSYQPPSKISTPIPEPLVSNSSRVRDHNLHQSSRANKGRFSTTRYINKVYLSGVQH